MLYRPNSWRALLFAIHKRRHPTASDGDGSDIITEAGDDINTEASDDLTTEG